MIVTRFPPSPTGYLHIGGVRTALYSWLHARQQQGKFVLRIEDTDKERSNEESVQVIVDGMQWLGLDHDEGPFYQSQRFARYAQITDALINEDHAYYCDCSKERLQSLREQQMQHGDKPKYDGHCRQLSLVRSEKTVVRFKNPLDGEVLIEDLVKGNISIQNSELDDLVIARSDGTPTYNLTVVVDDMDMDISHVIRGDDHINNTPRQINILHALGADVPAYAHVPMILGTDGARLSKRHGAVSVLQYKEEGYLPEALLNYLVRLGWSHADQEIFSIKEMIELFRIEDVGRAASAFNPEKLLWLNQEYIKALSCDDLLARAAPYFAEADIQLAASDNSSLILQLLQSRAKTLVDLVDQCRFFFQPPTQYDTKAVDKWMTAIAFKMLQQAQQSFTDLPIWSVEAISAELKELASSYELGFAKIAQPLRIAVSGSTQSPSIDQSLYLLGQVQVVARIASCLSALGPK